MAKASETDRYAAAVDAIYATSDTPTRWIDGLVAIAAVFDDVGAAFVFPKAGGAFGTIVTPGLEAAKRDFESSAWRDRDLRFIRAIERGYVANGQCVTDRHLVTDEEIETHPYYAELLWSHGLKYFVGLNVSPVSTVAAAISVQRAGDRKPFTDDEIAVMERLGRHVERALSLSTKLIQADAAHLSRAGMSSVAELAGIASGERIGVARAIDKMGVARGSDLATLLMALVEGDVAVRG